MVRAAACSLLLLALAAARCAAAPGPSDANLEHAVYSESPADPIDEIDVLSAENAEDPSVAASADSLLFRPPPRPGTQSDLSQWIADILRRVHRQLELQKQLLIDLLEDIKRFFRDSLCSTGGVAPQNLYVGAVEQTVERIKERMVATSKSMEALRAESSNLDPDTLRAQVGKFIKEVRVQEVLLDALWASMRGAQKATWLMTLSESAAPPPSPQLDGDAAAVAAAAAAPNRVAEEFLQNMQTHLQAAGIKEQDIEKFMPRLPGAPWGPQGPLPDSPTQPRSLVEVLEFFGVYDEAPIFGGSSMYSLEGEMQSRMLQPAAPYFDPFFAGASPFAAAAAAPAAASGALDGFAAFRNDMGYTSLYDNPQSFSVGPPSLRQRSLQGYGPAHHHGGPGRYPGTPYGYGGYGGNNHHHHHGPGSYGGYTGRGTGYYGRGRYF